MQITGAGAGTAEVYLVRLTTAPQAVRAILTYENRTEFFRFTNATTLRFAAQVESKLDSKHGGWVVVPRTDIDCVDIEFVTTPTDEDFQQAEAHFRMVVGTCPSL